MVFPVLTELSSPLPRHPALAVGTWLVEVTGSACGLIHHGRGLDAVTDTQVLEGTGPQMTTHARTGAEWQESTGVNIRDGTQ